MSGYQQVVIVGHAGKDADLKYLGDGTPVATINVAVNEKYKDNETTVWFRVSCWRKLAEVVAQYVKRGNQVMVTGKMTGDKTTGGPRVWITADGSARASYEIVADRVVFLSGGGSGDGTDAQGSEPEYDDDSAIPF